MNPDRSSLGGVPPVCDRDERSTIALRWSALHDAAGSVALLAGLSSEPLPPEVRDLGGLIRAAGGWRAALAEQGIDDLAAILEPGIVALLAVEARGASGKAAAQVLWQEFVQARDALLALVPGPLPETSASP
jgi:hypothetical protein